MKKPKKPVDTFAQDREKNQMSLESSIRLTPTLERLRLLLREELKAGIYEARQHHKKKGPAHM
jgi:hypothetical protein